MKFRNKETGEEFPYIQAARVSFCLYRENAAMMACYTCKLSSRNNGEHSGCVEFCEEHPHEAARLMGYEVVDEMREEMREPQLNAGKEEANMDKPYADLSNINSEDNQQAKADHGKPHPSYVPVALIEGVMAVREYGNQKYHDPDNWKQVEPGRFWEATLRHVLKAWNNPYSIDEESGLPNLWHIATNVAFLIEMGKKNAKSD